MLKNIGIVSFTPQKDNVKEVIQKIIEWSQTQNINITCHSSINELSIQGIQCHDDNHLKSCDLIVAIGGDGTILAASRITAGENIPILGVNTGTVGFLTDFHPSEIIEALDEFKQDKSSIVTRMMLEYNISSANEHIANKHPALNEIHLKSTHPEDLIKITVHLDNVFLTEYWADSLLISTPTGSTAYNLSSGGPIISPDADNIIINPVNPTSLSVRPLVVKSQTKISAQVHTPHPVSIIIDGKPTDILNSGETLDITKSQLVTYFICSKHFGFFNALRDKLGWNGKPNSQELH